MTVAQRQSHTLVFTRAVVHVGSGHSDMSDMSAPAGVEARSRDNQLMGLTYTNSTSWKKSLRSGPTPVRSGITVDHMQSVA